MGLSDEACKACGSAKDFDDKGRSELMEDP
jgi:hypothetical protein